MKSLNIFFIVIVLLTGCKPEQKQEQEIAVTPPAKEEVLPEGVIIEKQITEDTLKGSLKAYANQTIGNAKITIAYHSPAARGRIIWGGLVPLDKVWVTGAHMATALESSVSFTLGDTSIPAGKYGFFTIPGKEKWTVIINKNWKQHLTDEYDVKDDIARIEVIPQSLTENQERLRYQILSSSNQQAEIVIQWEKIQLNIPLTLNP